MQDTRPYGGEGSKQAQAWAYFEFGLEKDGSWRLNEIVRLPLDTSRWVNQPLHVGFFL